MNKTTLILMVSTILSNILGLGREVILSNYYGASNISDAYLISQTIPGTIFSFIGVGITTSFIPIYSKVIKTSGIDMADRFTNYVINTIILICTLITLMVLIFTVPAVRLFASGFKGNTLDLTVHFTRISIFGIYFSGMTYVFTAYLQLKNSYVTPALTGIWFNLILIFSVILSYKFNTYILAIGILLAMISQSLFLIPLIQKKGYKYKPALNLKDPNLLQILYLSLPVILGVSVNQINTIIDRTLASQISVGGISALNYSSRIIFFVQGIFAISIVTVMYPAISKMAVDGNMKGLKKSVQNAVNGVNLLILPATIGIIVFTEPIIKLLFGRGAFNHQAIFTTSNALFFFSIGLVGYGLREVLSRVFYSLEDTKTPMINAGLSVILNIILSVTLSRFLGIGGLALATSISGMVCTALLFVNLRKKIGSIGLKKITVSTIKILIASLMMGIIAKSIYSFLDVHEISNVSLIISIVISVLSYFIIVLFLKIEGADILFKTLFKKSKKANSGTPET